MRRKKKVTTGKMVKYGQNGQIWSNTVKYDQFGQKNGQQWSKTIQNNQNGQYGQKRSIRSKTVKNCEKRSKTEEEKTRKKNKKKHHNHTLQKIRILMVMFLF